MLESFVNETDYNYLIKLLTYIHEDTLRQNTSILIIKGDNNSGKSTLMEIMKELSPSSCHKCFGKFGIDGCSVKYKKESVETWNSSLIFLSEISSEINCNDTLRKYHQSQRETGFISLFPPPLFPYMRKKEGIKEPTVYFDPGVFVVAHNDKYY